jgi:hypothetical protein
MVLRVVDLINEKITLIKQKQLEAKVRDRSELIDAIFGFSNQRAIENFIISQKELERKKQEEENIRFWKSM